MRVTSGAVIALLVCAGCGGDESSHAAPDARVTDGGATDTGGTDTTSSGNVRPAQIELKVLDAQTRSSLGGFNAPAGYVFIDVGITLKNVDEEQPILPYYSSNYQLRTSDAWLYFTDGVSFYEPNACPYVLLERGGMVSCRIAFEILREKTATQLVYEYEGRSVTVQMPIVTPGVGPIATVDAR